MKLSIAEQIIKASNSKSKIVHVPMRPGEPKKATVFANPNTLKPLGDYKFIPYEKRIKETVDWYEKNYDWKKS